MPKDDRRLGKGLAALLGENLDQATAPAENTVPLTAIRPNPFQPRGEFEPTALADLAASIDANGLLQPIVLRASGEAFEIVAGERRFRAVQTLGWASVPAIVRPLTDEEMLVIALVENLQRENLSPLEEARGYRQLIDEFDLTQEEVGAHVGRDRSTVANALRLLGLPEAVQSLLAAGSLSAGHARAILSVTDESAQISLAHAAVDGGWSVRETERRARSDKPPRARKPRRSASPAATRDPVIRRAEIVLERGLGTQVRIRTASDGSGELAVHFHDSDDFLRLIELMGGESLAAELRG